MRAPTTLGIATLLAALLSAATVHAETYSDSQEQTFATAGATTTFTFENLPDPVGDGEATIELWGAYGDADVETTANVELDGNLREPICESGCREGCNTRARSHTYTLDSSLVADGTLEVVVDNTEGVDPAACDDNRIRVTVEYPTNSRPVADDAEITVREDTPETFTLPASDPDGDELTVEFAESPEHGTITTDGLEATYTPEQDFHGTDAFRYLVHDARRATSGEADVTLVVEPVNDPPTWISPERTTHQIVAGDTLELVAEATDVDDPDDTLTYGIEQAPTGSDFNPDTGNFAWTPDRSQVGEHAIVFTVSDGEATVRREVSVVVEPPEGRPDAGTPDAGLDDAGRPDASAPDSGPDATSGRPDVAPADTAPPPEFGLQGGGCSNAGGRAPGSPHALAILLLWCAFAATHRGRSARA